jgi:hypothetical protein
MTVRQRFRDSDGKRDRFLPEREGPSETGVRFDYLQNHNPAQTALRSTFVPVARFCPAQDAVSWKDPSPPDCQICF